MMMNDNVHVDNVHRVARTALVLLAKEHGVIRPKGERFVAYRPMTSCYWMSVLATSAHLLCS